MTPEQLNCTPKLNMMENHQDPAHFKTARDALQTHFFVSDLIT
jgi:hypothetical protein